MSFADRPLRILFISRQFWPVVHGAETQMLRLSAALARDGHTVQVLSARFDPRWPKQETLENDRVPLLRLSSPRARGLGTICFLGALASHLIRRRADYDIVHVNALKYSAALAAFLCPRLGLPVLGRSVCAGSLGDMAHLRTLPTPRVMLRYLHRLDRVVALSDAIRGELLADGFSPNRIVLIPNAVDEEQFRPPSPPEREAAQTLLPDAARSRLIAVTTARLATQKGLEYLIDAFREPGVRARWAAVILGEGEERSRLEGRVAQDGLARDVFFLGEVRDVRPWLHAADAFCLPSLFEGMSNSLLEAMACGLPILATRVSGTVDIVEDGKHGLLAVPSCSADLAAGLKRLEDPRARRELGQAARRRVEETCGLRRIARRHVDLYREMIGDKNRARNAAQ